MSFYSYFSGKIWIFSLAASSKSCLSFCCRTLKRQRKSTINKLILIQQEFIESITKQQLQARCTNLYVTNLKYMCNTSYHLTRYQKHKNLSFLSIKRAQNVFVMILTYAMNWSFSAFSWSAILACCLIQRSSSCWLSCSTFLYFSSRPVYVSCRAWCSSFNIYKQREKTISQSNGKKY